MFEGGDHHALDGHRSAGVGFVENHRWYSLHSLGETDAGLHTKESFDFSAQV